ncbi:MAG: MFS transporter [Gammaproteobacteria bacterium]|nr:MFS transporter [Gammaproteobacteria bacterium]
MRRAAIPALYAVPAVPLAFLGLPLYVYLPAHYADLPGIGLALVGAVLLLARLFDVVTDPLIGLLADRSRSVLHPASLISVGVLMLGVGAWYLFQPPLQATAFYLLLTLSITYLGWTLLAIPYYALGAEFGDDEGDHQGQTRFAAWREAGMIVGTVAALTLPVIIDGDSALVVVAHGLVWLLPLALAAVWLLPRSEVATPAGGAQGGLRAMWRDTSSAARQLLGIHLLNALAGGTAATLFVIYSRDVLGVGERDSGLLLLLYFAAGLLALPLWVALARRIGEVRAWRAAMLFAAAGFIPAALLGEGQLSAFAVVCVLTGATLGADIALPAAIQGRIVAHESRVLARPRGGALFGLWGMAGKLALALAAGISLPLLALLTSQSAGLDRSTVTPWLYAGLPVVIKLVAVILLQRSCLVGPLSHLQPSSSENHDDPIQTAVAVRRGADAGRL